MAVMTVAFAQLDANDAAHNEVEDAMMHDYIYNDHSADDSQDAAPAAQPEERTLYKPFCEYRFRLIYLVTFINLFFF